MKITKVDALCKELDRMETLYNAERKVQMAIADGRSSVYDYLCFNNRVKFWDGLNDAADSIANRIKQLLENE